MSNICPICNDDLGSKAVMLPCLHLLCSQCVDDIIRIAHEESTKPKCYLCNESFEEKQLIDWPTNATASSSLLFSSLALASLCLCGECIEAAPALYKCLTCDDFLCALHGEGHRKSKKTADHVVQSLETTTPPPPPSSSSSSSSLLSASSANRAAGTISINNALCQTHQKEIFSFCATCQSLVCTECATGLHRKHEFIGFDEAKATFQASLKANYTKLAERLPLIDKATDNFKSLLTSLDTRRSSIVNEIQECFKPLSETLRHRIHELELRLKALDQRSSQLQEEATQEVQAVTKTIELQQRALEIFKDHVLLVQQSLTLTPVDAIAQINMNKILSSRIDELQQVELTLQPLATDTIRFHFTKPLDVISCLIDGLGKIFYFHDRDYKAISQPVRVFGCQGTEPGCFNNPMGIAQMSDGNIVVGEYNNKRLQIFTSDGEHVHTLALGHFIYQITLSSTGEIWAASANSNTLLCLSTQGTILKQISMPYPVSLTVLSNGTIVASGEQSIQAFSPEGTLLWTSKGNEIQNPRGILLMNSEEILVCDSGHSRLQVLSLTNGRFIRFIGVGRLLSPCGLALIPGTDMIIVSQQYSVSILTLAGDFVHHWGGKGTQPGQFHSIYSPAYGSVAVLQNGDIAVVDEGNHRIQVF